MAGVVSRCGNFEERRNNERPGRTPVATIGLDAISHVTWPKQAGPPQPMMTKPSDYYEVHSRGGGRDSTSGSQLAYTKRLRTRRRHRPEYLCVADAGGFRIVDGHC